VQNHSFVAAVQLYSNDFQDNSPHKKAASKEAAMWIRYGAVARIAQSDVTTFLLYDVKE